MRKRGAKVNTKRGAMLKTRFWRKLRAIKRFR